MVSKLCQLFTSQIFDLQQCENFCLFIKQVNKNKGKLEDFISGVSSTLGMIMDLPPHPFPQPLPKTEKCLCSSRCPVNVKEHSGGKHPVRRKLLILLLLLLSQITGFLIFLFTSFIPLQKSTSISLALSDGRHMSFWKEAHPSGQLRIIPLSCIFLFRKCVSLPFAS